LDKETVFQRVQSAIISATKEPKYVTVSSVKLADLLGTTPPEIERYIQELVQEGRLKKETLSEPPQFDIYMLP
jgi:predicted HTH transcriptional regulator